MNKNKESFFFLRIKNSVFLIDLLYSFFYSLYDECDFRSLFLKRTDELMKIKKLFCYYFEIGGRGIFSLCTIYALGSLYEKFIDLVFIDFRINERLNLNFLHCTLTKKTFFFILSKLILHHRIKIFPKKKRTLPVEKRCLSHKNLFNYTNMTKFYSFNQKRECCIQTNHLGEQKFEFVSKKID